MVPGRWRGPTGNTSCTHWLPPYQPTLVSPRENPIIHDPVTTLLSALHRDPTDVTCWLALADALEEGGEPDRAELVRLTLGYWGWVKDQDFDSVNERLQHLLASGV